MIPEQSVLLREAGYAVLRSGPMSVAVRFGMHGGGHGHPDKLNIVTFAAGHLFGLDPGSINYGVPLHKEWYRSTIAHNTVSVDRQVQQNVDGRLLEWQTEGGETVLAASTNDAYPGVEMRRTLRLKDGRLDDRYTCVSKEEHVYDWAFHAAGKFTSSLEFGKWPGDLYLHVESVAEAKTDGDWWARWEIEGAQYTLRVKAAPGTEVFSGVGPGKNPADRVPMIVVRRRGKNTAYEVVHEVR
jgi:oligo-alginate lyase